MKCYNCGGEVIVAEGSRIGICSCCMAEIPLPEEGSSIAEAYSDANLLLSESRFDEAREAFREILIRKPMEAAACWGMVISEYGIEFVQDPMTGELLPTLHRLSSQRFSEHMYVKQAIQYAKDLETRNFYQVQSRQIDLIQTQSLQISQKEEPYDVFICYKKTEEGEKRTADSRMAADLYRELVSRGYKVFFAEETLRVGEEYEPRIFAALHSAKILLAIASKREYYDAVWVRNEWSRYVDLIRVEAEQGQNTRLLIPVYQNIDKDALPEALAQMPHHVDMSRLVNPRQELMRLVGDHFDHGKKEDVSDIRRQVRVAAGAKGGNVRMETSAENFMTRAMIQLVGGRFDDAEDIFNKSLEMERSSGAYLGLLMCDLKVPGKEALFRYDQRIDDHPMYNKAMACASKQEQEELKKLATACQENYDWSMECAKMKAKCTEVVGDVVKNVKNAKLATPAFKKYNEEIAWTDQIVRYHTVAADSGSVGRTLGRFLLIGNLIPSIGLVLRPVLESTSYFLPIVSVYGLLMFYGYFWCLNRMLAEIEFLEEGFIKGLIRLGIGYFLLMCVLSVAEARPWIVFLVAFVAYLIYYLVYGNKVFKAKKEVANGRKLAKEKQQQLDHYLSAMKASAETVLEERVKPYRQYYTQEQEWNEMLTEGKTAIEHNLRNLREKLETALKNLM